MQIIEINSLSHPGVEVFATLTEAQLRNRLEPQKGIFIAESPKVIHVALNAGYEPLALLCERKHIEGDAVSLIERCGDIPVYTGERELLASLTGYTLTRGVLCAMRRPAPKSVEEVCQGAKRIAVIDGVVDTTNIGAIFRSAAALGIDAVLLTPSSCDPLNRRAVRVSMGSGLPPAVDVARSPHQLAPHPRFPHRCHGTERKLRPHRPPKSEGRTATGHRAGHRRRRTLHASDSRNGLCGTHPHVARSGLAERGSCIGRSFLGTEGTMKSLY